jgi:curved DNA-binding protein CbpA
MEELKSEFELFGLDEKLDLKSLKRAYYDLALIVHPDRNTCINKEDANFEMNYVTESYKTLKAILEKSDFENEVKNSNDLKENYNESLVTFQDIYYETQDEILKEKNWNDTEFTTEDLVINTCSGFQSELPSEYRNSDFNKVTYDPNVDTEEKVEEFKTSDAIIPIENIGTLTLNNISSDYPHDSFPNPNLVERLPKNINERFENLQDIDLLLEKKMHERSEIS